MNIVQWVRAWLYPDVTEIWMFSDGPVKYHGPGRCIIWRRINGKWRQVAE